MQHCEKCNHDTTLIQSVRESAMAGYVDYYRCRVCGEVWGAKSGAPRKRATNPTRLSKTATNQ